MLHARVDLDRPTDIRVRQFFADSPNKFFAAHGWTVTVSSRQPGTYHHLEQALLELLEEVRLRIASNVRL